MNRPTWLRAIDWKFWLALSLAIMVGYLSFVGYAAVQDGREKDRQINALIRTAETKDASAARRDAAASAERAVAAENQRALLDYTKALAGRQHALLEWLRANGIDIPVRFVREIPAPKVAAPGPTKPRTHRPSTKRSTAPADRRPGKSGQAPGHNKKRGNR